MNKKEKFRRMGEGIINIRNHGTPKVGRADGSIGTKPSVPCPDVLEAVVLDEVESWLGRNRIVYDRNNTGSGDIRGDGRIFRYGIKDAGDIIGLLPSGRHLEIECKRGRGGSWSLGQQERCKKIRENNGIYMVVHGACELEILMGELL